jgi:FkbM family methyltransferase
MSTREHRHRLLGFAPPGSKHASLTDALGAVATALKPLKYALKLAILRRVPRLYWAARRALKGPLEPEMLLVAAFADRTRVALDIGANFGAWTTQLATQFAAVHAFEPQGRLAAALAEGAPPNVFVHAVAVSDHPCLTAFRVPRKDLGRSTIEVDNPLPDLDSGAAEIDHREVLTARLDDLGFAGSVAFIKIDVEGHEVSVLRGAATLLAESRPIVLIESESRHRHDAPSDVRALMHAAGYLELSLDPRGRNLLFVPSGKQGPPRD